MRLAPSIIPQLFSSSHDLDWCLVMKILSKETSTNKAKLFSLFYIQLFCLILMSSSSPSFVFLSLRWWQRNGGKNVLYAYFFSWKKTFSSSSLLYRLVLYSESEWAIVFSLSFSVCFFPRSQSAIIRHQKGEKKLFHFCLLFFPGIMNKKRKAMVIRRKKYARILISLIILIKFPHLKQLHYHNNNNNFNN